jgi:hypothetical protein
MQSDAIGGHQRPSDAIRCNRRHSEALRGHQPRVAWHSVEITCHPGPIRANHLRICLALAIRCNQMQSDAIRCNRRPSEAIRCNQMQSEALRGTQRPSAPGRMALGGNHVSSGPNQSQSPADLPRSGNQMQSDAIRANQSQSEPITCGSASLWWLASSTTLSPAAICALI